MAHPESSGHEYCAGCGKPPMEREDGSIVSLKVCSRCRQVSYHGRECQKAHFPAHRDFCRQFSGSGKSRSSLGYQVEVKAGRGRCLVATENLRTGQYLRDSKINASAFQPVVPPVLRMSSRKTHCACCFSAIEGCRELSTLSESPRYTVVVCSAKCYSACRSWIQDEITAVNSVPQSIPVILSTAVIICRLLWAVSLGTLDPKEILTLQSHPTEATEDAQVHEKAIGMTINSIISGSTEIQKNLSPDLVHKLLSSIKYNTFTIPDYQDRPIGLGLFETTYRINHSCSPNALQSYTLGSPGEIPRLGIQLVREIKEGEEITISYLDQGQSRGQRQHFLLENYHFACKCDRCTNEP